VLRLLALSGGLAFAIVAFATRSQAGVLAAVAVLVVGALAMSRWSFVLSLVLPVTVAAVALGSVLLGAAHHPEARTQAKVVHAAERALSERRVALWHDAVVLTADHPGVGVGPGRFAETSPMARSDKDTAWAHSGWLQQSAEQGLVGLALLAGTAAWAWVPLVSAARRSAGTRAGAVAVAGSGALGALLLCGSVDYVLHFAVLGLVCASLVGAATSSCAGRSD
jgi:O-antigen ligase